MTDQAMETAGTSAISGFGMSVGHNLKSAMGGAKPAAQAGAAADNLADPGAAAPGAAQEAQRAGDVDFNVPPEGEAIHRNNGQQNQEAAVDPLEHILDGVEDQTPVKPPKTQLEQDLDRAAEAAINGTPVDTAAANDATTVKEHITMEDYANKESPVWRNVAYEDNATKSSIMQETHQRMVDSGAVVKVDDGVMENVAQSYPDMRGVKKKERIPVLKQAITTLKNNLRQYLLGISNQSFEFEVNGKILEAKLYSTGINEVLEKVTQEKAGMLYSSEEVFRNAQYLYSTPDYDEDVNVYRWNYFYTPVQIGDETVGVRIAVRDMSNPQESQIYNWNIKKDTSLDGVGRGADARISHGVSSDVSTDTVAQPEPIVKQNSPDLQGAPSADTQNPSADGGHGFEAMGAADQNFTGSDGQARQSATFTNSGVNNADANVAAAYRETLSSNPQAAEYTPQSHEETRRMADGRTDTPEKRSAERQRILSSDNWSAVDNIVCDNLMKAAFPDKDKLRLIGHTSTECFGTTRTWIWKACGRSQTPSDGLFFIL